MLAVDLGHLKVVSSLASRDGSVRVSSFCNLNVNSWFSIAAWRLSAPDAQLIYRTEARTLKSPTWGVSIKYCKYCKWPSSHESPLAQWSTFNPFFARRSAE